MASTDTISQKRDRRIPKSKSKRMVDYLVGQQWGIVGSALIAGHEKRHATSFIEGIAAQAANYSIISRTGANLRDCRPAAHATVARGFGSARNAGGGSASAGGEGEIESARWEQARPATKDAKPRREMGGGTDSTVRPSGLPPSLTGVMKPQVTTGAVRLAPAQGLTRIAERNVRFCHSSPPPAAKMAPIVSPCRRLSDKKDRQLAGRSINHGQSRKVRQRPGRHSSAGRACAWAPCHRHEGHVPRNHE